MFLTPFPPTVPGKWRVPLPDWGRGGRGGVCWVGVLLPANGDVPSTAGAGEGVRCPKNIESCTKQQHSHECHRRSARPALSKFARWGRFPMLRSNKCTANPSNPLLSAALVFKHGFLGLPSWDILQPSPTRSITSLVLYQSCKSAFRERHAKPCDRARKSGRKFLIRLI
jgi:hypothetical protein